MKKVLLFFLLLLSFRVQCQISATTESGQKVVLNENGTWEYTSQSTEEKPNASLYCIDLVSVDVDKMTGKTSTSSKEVILISTDGGETGFGILLLKSNSLIMSIQAVGAGSCIDDNDKMNVLFRDGTRIEMANDSDFNCKAKFTLYLGGSFGKKKELELFKTKEVETMRIWTSDGFVERDFTPEQSLTFMETIKCLEK